MINNILLKVFSGYLKEIEVSQRDPLGFQKDWLARLLESGSNTAFGKEHCFNRFSFNNKHEYLQKLNYFQQNVPVRDYNAFVPYINRMRKGEDYVLWDQKVRWFAKSSGTSSDRSKFIPITPDALKINHYGGFQRMLSWYIANNPASNLFKGKSLTLGGSVQIDELGSGNCAYGDLSAILLKNSPALVEIVRTPKRETALIADFNAKLEQICKESSSQNVTNFSGVPSWNLILLNKILEYTGKSNICQVWPNMELFMHGGTGFDPYRDIFKELIPSDGMHYLENYNASEGYFAFQDDLSQDSMLLTVNNGVFYEFIPMDIYDKVMSGLEYKLPTLEDVVTGVDYAVVITTCSGLWRYVIGDCVRFTSTFPHRIRITGRTQLCINAFGEELMIANAEKALAQACRQCNCSVSEFTAAPVFMTLRSLHGASATTCTTGTSSGNSGTSSGNSGTSSGNSGNSGTTGTSTGNSGTTGTTTGNSGTTGTTTKGYHRWAIEFSRPPEDLESFASCLDSFLSDCNSDYAAKRSGDATMQRLQIIPLPEGTFIRWMEKRNKLGGQNKVPRLHQTLQFIEELTSLG